MEKEQDEIGNARVGGVRVGDGRIGDGRVGDGRVGGASVGDAGIADGAGAGEGGGEGGGEVLPSFRSRIFLLRHAEVSYVTAEGAPILETDSVPLTEAGCAQAKLAGDALRAVMFDRVIASPLLRTMQTARFVVAGREQVHGIHGIEGIETLSGLREIAEGDYGDLPDDAGLKRRELSYAYERAVEEGARYAGGDSYVSFARRVRGAFFPLLEGDWRNLLIVSHDAVNRVILGSVLLGGGSDDDIVSILRLLPRLEQDYGCMNLIEVDRREGDILLRVKMMNVTGYDLGKVGLGLTSMERAFAGWLGVG